MTNKNRNKKPPARKGFITAWSEKRQCWSFVPRSTPAMVKKREKTKEGLPPARARAVEVWSVSTRWENRRKVVTKDKKIADFDTVAECAEEYGTDRMVVHRIASGLYGSKTFNAGGEVVTFVFADGKVAGVRQNQRHERGIKRREFAFRKRKKG